MPLDHFCLIVSEDKLEKIVSWLIQSNSIFNFQEITRPAPHVVGLGEEKNRAYFWIWSDPSTQASEYQLKEWRKQHIAFAAESVEQVHAWYESALKAGGEDNGRPGPRPEYHAGYYGAFVRDPVLGINFEAVYREPSRRNIWATESTTA
ncbi:hypothetical protein AC578_2209 [Pseudocercospora eumusae]|uniref:VOC domain-containing protein n=1 Tax=Pseudocercospora eumusae TaxID=321146 RepID=A0A139HAW2_9PEZI|nr:hypothetical protein AC578_2209 [Pseudocercospora eumusae]